MDNLTATHLDARDLPCSYDCGVPITKGDDIKVGETKKGGRLLFHWRCWSDWDTEQYYLGLGFTREKIRQHTTRLGPPRRPVMTQ